MQDHTKPAPDVYAHPIYANDEEPISTSIPIPHTPLLIGSASVIALVVAGLFIFSGSREESGESVRLEPTATAKQQQTTPDTQPLPDISVNQEMRTTDETTTKITETTAHEPKAQTTIQPKAPINTDDRANTAKEKNEPDGKWLTHKIAGGDTISRIFSKLGLSATLLHRITNSDPKGKTLAKIRPGQIIKVKVNIKGEFEQLIWAKSPLDSLIITRSDQGFNYQSESKQLETRGNQTRVLINNSLFVDGQKAGLSDQLIMKLAAIFGWDIDFALGIRKGDQFSLVYEEKYLEGSKYGEGDILAAEFINRGKRYRAIRYQDPTGEVGYYTPNGKSMRKAFLRTPVKFSRISSGFTTRRWHPVLEKWRSHRGVDYAAPTGTPIKATGKGKVIFSGWKGGYGRVVYIKHNSKYTTVYGHLSSFSKDATIGSLIQQGDIIGYVGQSGLATGPHLHYEMRVNGVHKNPLTVKLPSAKPIPAKYYLAFSDHANELIAQLAMISNAMVAEQR